LNEFCYKFNRKYFGDRMFDRLVIAAVSYKPTFEHKLYNSRANCG
ncbi:MAG: IS1595 family transposase, partial [Bacteroidaceae bacterium]|nr:IS1595 family transposase [Bacteroidaceae bacterium]